MIKFLNREDTEQAVKSLIKDSKRLRIAVAYWGKEAVTRLLKGVNKAKDITIVCDLLSGGCNPKEIIQLQKQIGVDHVLKRNDLHAKVWLTERGAILGSSNASANGIGREGKATNGLIEANVLIDDPQILERLQIWFESEVLVGATSISKGDITRAKKVRGMKPPPPIDPKNSLLTELAANPDRFEGAAIYVWVYGHGNFDKEQNELLKKIRKERNQSSILCWGWDDGEPIPPRHSYILDFDVVNGKAELETPVWQILADEPLVSNSRGRKLLLCRGVTAKTAFGAKLGDKKMWESAATNAAATRKGEWQIAKFARKFLRANVA